jgi:hypothetical protein
MYGDQTRSCDYLVFLTTFGKGIRRMRKLALAVAAVVALSFFPGSAFSETFEIGPGGVRSDDGAAPEQADNVKSCASLVKTRTG